ncbi:ABC transporter permease subunit, partial [Streptomyces sp. XY332]|uniref:ABC transporter permease subunit n=1 Tax=Streptomyces sp. XY332 TaxID=1415561 RepID=UPI000AFE2733
SARLMGLPVGSTKIAVYAVSGLCSALGGLLLTFYMLSGYALHAMGMELDAIAATVIGGTLLTGGFGFVPASALECRDHTMLPGMQSDGPTSREHRHGTPIRTCRPGR